MNLLIVSHTPHYRTERGLVGWGPTVREIDHLAHLFDPVVHVAPLHAGPPPASALPYRAAIQARLVKPAGGPRPRDKARALLRFPSWVRVIRRELRAADLLHVRCPANISMAALTALQLVGRRPLTWIKYAGNWRPSQRDPRSYALQRWWLERGLHGGVTTVNGSWPDQPAHVHSLLNPSYTVEEAQRAAVDAATKRLVTPLRLLFVGALTESKGVDRALRIAGALSAEGVPIHLDVLGDGPRLPTLRSLSAELGLEARARFHGWKSRDELQAYYAQAHFLLHPSRSEGWPKVVSEAMAHGVVPLVGAVSSIPQVLEQTGAGFAFEPSRVDPFVGAIRSLQEQPERWEAMRDNGLASTHRFTYERYKEELQRLFALAWGVRLP